MLTVLLSTRNRGSLLRSVLEAFSRLREPASGWKLLIVDNGSTDQTPEVLALFKRRLPLHVLAEHKPGKNIALNAALAHIEGDLTVLTDDDVFPREDWLLQLTAAAEAHKEFSVFGGVIQPCWEALPPSWIEWVDKGAVFAITDPAWQEGPIPANCVWGPNMAFRSNIFRSGVRFDTSIGPKGANYVQGGDTEFTRRLESLGHRSWHVRGAIVEHFIRNEQMSKEWVLRRAIRHGRGEFLLGQAEELVSRKTLLGSPRYLYRKLYGEARAIAVSWLMGKQGESFQAKWRFNYVRGQIQEARALSKEKKKEARSVPAAAR